MFLLLTIASCNNKHAQQVIDKAESLLITSPDSALAILDSLKAEDITMPQSQRMLLELVRADAQNKAYVDFTTDSLMLKVADYFDHHGTSNQQMRAHYLLGCTYRDLGDVSMELHCFQEATEKADTTKKDCDLYTLGAIYGQMANLYHNQFLPDEELKVLEKCEKVAWMDHDTLTAIKAYELRIRPYFLVGNNDSVLQITKNARNRFLKQNNRKLAAQLLCPAISIMLNRAEIDSARTYMDIYEKESGMFTNGKISLNHAKIYYRNKGRLHLMCNQIDSAKYYFEELRNSSYKEAAYEGLFRLYKKTNVLDSLTKYACLYTEANDSDRLSANSEVIAQMSAMYDYTLQEKKNQALSIRVSQQKLANKTMLLYVALATFVLILLILFGTYLYKEHYRKNKIELEQTITRYNSIHQMLEESEKQKELLETKLLSAEVISTDLIQKYQNDISILNERIQKANDLILDYKKRYINVDFDVWLDKFLKAEIVFEFKDIVKPHKAGHVYTADKKMWNLLFGHFNTNAQEFVCYINKEDFGLVDIDIRVIMLTILNFGTNEIALLLDKSGNHITNIRKRITEKIFNGKISPRKLREELLSEMERTILTQ